MSQQPLEDDPAYQQFCERLEGLRGQMPLHKPNDFLVQRILRQLPRADKPPRRAAFLRWISPFALGGALASAGFLIFSPNAPFQLVRKMPATFVLENTQAKTVHLVGDFNQWSTNATQMVQKDGKWATTVRLAPGRYQYKFLVDGKEWVKHPSTQAEVTDGYGGYNGVIETTVPTGSRVTPTLVFGTSSSEDPRTPQESAVLAAFPQIIQEARSRHLPKDLLERRVREGLSKNISQDRIAARLTSLLTDYQTANYWLADAGVTSPANKAYGLDGLTELIATGFSDADWRLYRQAMPTPRSVTELVQGAQCAHLWQRTGAAPEAWQPILRKAAEQNRIQDLLVVSQTVRAEQIHPQRVMNALQNGLDNNKNTQNILSEMRSVAALPNSLLPLDNPQARVDKPLQDPVPLAETPVGAE